MQPRNRTYRAKYGDDMNEERKSARSKADFIRLTGIGPELAEFVAELVERPEIVFSMSPERRQKMERQMDAIISSLMHSKIGLGTHPKEHS